MSNWFLFIATSFLFHNFISCVIGVVPFLTYLNLLPCLLVTSAVLLEGSVWSLFPQMAVISRVEFVVSPEWWHFSSVLCASWFWVHLLRPDLGWALVRPLSCLCPSLSSWQPGAGCLSVILSGQEVSFWFSASNGRCASGLQPGVVLAPAYCCYMPCILMFLLGALL